MDITEDKEQVVITMSPDEYRTFQGAYQNAWFFIREAVRNSIPSGRTFGKGQLDEGNELEMLKARVEKLEGDTSAVINGHNQGIARISDLARRLTDETTRVNALRNMVHEIRDAGSLGDISEAQAAIRSRMDWIQETQAEVQGDTERRLASIENELSNPLSKVQLESMSADELERIKQRIKTEPMQVLPQTRFQVVKASALNRAAQRVREYMEGSFSEGTIRGVVDFLYGDEVPTDRRIDQSKLITDHAFRFSSPDRRHCSYRIGGGDRCDHLESEHEYHQAKPKPIRDNPQG